MKDPTTTAPGIEKVPTGGVVNRRAPKPQDLQQKQMLPFLTHSTIWSNISKMLVSTTGVTG